MSDEKKMTQEESQQIIQNFQQMRNEQKSLMNKIAELDQELVEHKAVYSKLSEVEEDRRCFRVIGGVLVERTVKEVMPAVNNNRIQLEKLMVKLNEDLVKKGKDLVDFKEKHGLKMVEPGQADSAAAKQSRSVLVDGNKA